MEIAFLLQIQDYCMNSEIYVSNRYGASVNAVKYVQDWVVMFLKVYIY